MENSKEQVIRLFLASLANHVPLPKAQLATLGGQGMEAGIWSELGVPMRNGWLIERARERNGALIRKHQYNVCNQLGTFDKILAGHGTETSIDAFHLDLCGTLSDRAIDTFAPALPLVLKSPGRHLAITVADARRNAILENWPQFRFRGRRLLGGDAAHIYERILEQQKLVPVRHTPVPFIKPFDPEKGAKREFGILVELLELLRKQKLPWLPVAIRRYIYVSRYNERPFRMRTYVFRFGTQPSHKPECAFANAWIESELFYANGEGFHAVEKPNVPPTITTIPQKGNQTVSTNKAPTLADVAHLFGGELLAEYESLKGDSDNLKTIRKTLAGLNGNAGNAPAEMAETTSFAPPPPVMPKGKPGRKPRKSWATISPAEQIDFQIRAVEMKQRHGGTFPQDVWQKLLKETFGHYDTALGSSMRSVIARTSGGHRNSFEKRIKEVMGPNAQSFLERLEAASRG